MRVLFEFIFIIPHEHLYQLLHRASDLYLQSTFFFHFTTSWQFLVYREHEKKKCDKGKNHQTVTPRREKNPRA